METADASQPNVFFEVHKDLPREGPGCFDSTRQALEVIRDAGCGPLERVADIGCGPGMQTLDLARLLPQARFVALDLHAPFLRDLSRRALAQGVADRVHPVRADMARLPLADEGVELVWCEGAAYSIGVSACLERWQRILRPDGAVAFTDAVWLEQSVPEPVRHFWTEYPDMGDRETGRSRVRAAGLELLGDFVLPSRAWWDDYYGPMEDRLEQLRRRYQGDDDALAELDEHRQEIELFREYHHCYGYAFFVARKPVG